jgi:RNA polymerase sigma-70 factor, ECF subfamily
MSPNMVVVREAGRRRRWPRCDKRDDAALASVFPALSAVAVRLCGDRADAQDLVQDTFERVLRVGIPGEIRCVLAWMTTVMKRLFIDRCRVAARHGREQCSIDGDTYVVEPEAAIEPQWAALSQEDLQCALAQLPPIYREVYVRHSFERQSYEQIAADLAIATFTVGSRLTRARAKLRKILVQWASQKVGVDGAAQIGDERQGWTHAAVRRVAAAL